MIFKTVKEFKNQDRNMVKEGILINQVILTAAGKKKIKQDMISNWMKQLQKPTKTIKVFLKQGRTAANLNYLEYL